jgi:hypothetical protein
VVLIRSWPRHFLSCHNAGRHGSTLRGGCQHIAVTFGGGLFAQTSHSALTCFAQGLAPCFAHSSWAHLHNQAVPTAASTFFELASSSSKNVAADRKTTKFSGQRRMGTVQEKAASRPGSRLKPSCGHRPASRHARQLVATRTRDHTEERREENVSAHNICILADAMQVPFKDLLGPERFKVLY